MPNKNDLSAIQGKSKNTLKQQPVKPGRKPKPKEAKESKTIALHFTELEYQAIQEQAGLVPLATFLKAKLKEARLELHSTSFSGGFQ